MFLFKAHIKFSAILIATIGFIFLASCSKTTVHDDGSVTMAGLMHVTIKSTEAPETFAGNVIDTRSIGVSIYQSELSSGLTIGTNRVSVAALKNNVLVTGDPINIK